VWWIIAHNERDGAFLNSDLLCGDNFFEMTPSSHLGVEYLFAILCSSWIVLQRELFGRSGFGGGLLKTQGPDVRQMMIPNPKKLAPKDVAGIKKAGKKLLRLKPTSIFGAWESMERAALDITVMKCLGLNEDAARMVYEEAQVLVRTRQDRAKTKEGK